MKRNAGEEFLFKDEEILKIDSPRKNLRGPWLVVKKDAVKRWAMVAMHWRGTEKEVWKPCFGIRWFWSTQGMPHVVNCATWFVLPEVFNPYVFKELESNPELKERIEKIFATGEDYSRCSEI